MDFKPTNANVCFSIQIQRLKQMTKGVEEKLQQINSDIKMYNNIEKTPEQSNKEMEEMSKQVALNKILNILNGAFFGNEEGVRRKSLQKNENGKYDYKEGANKETIQNDIKAEVEKLNQLLSLFNMSPQKIKNIIKNYKIAAGYKGSSKKNADGNYKNYKAKVIEELVGEAFNNMGGSFKVLVTGDVTDSAGKQLIEDIIIVNENDYQKLDKVLLKKLEALNGEATISFTNEEYEKLKKVADLKVQVKSGYGDQDILNRSTSSGGRFTEQYNNLNKSRLLKSFFVENQHNNKEDKQNLQELVNLSNYCLSLSIAKTKLADNDIYYTKDGFILAADWMKKYNKMLAFSDYTIDQNEANFMNRSRPYQFITK